jgi:hypothetical protein
MCTDYEGPKPEQKAEIERKVRQEIFGFVPRARVRPTDPAAELDALLPKLMSGELRVPAGAGSVEAHA